MLRSLFSYFIFGLMPLLGLGQSGFIENIGQFSDEVYYEVDYHTQKIYLDEDGFTVLLHNQEKWVDWVEDFHHYRGKKKKHNSSLKTMEFQAIKYRFINANLSNRTAIATYPTRYNYFIGKDQSKWVSNAKKHSKILYHDIYPNIDLEFEAIDERFKYNFILRPGAHIADIELAIVGADRIQVSERSIDVVHRFGSYQEVMPLCYISTANGNENIEMTYYQARDGRIKFNADFNTTSELTVIDPELIFSTYSGSTVDNFGFTATYDSYGNLYAGGIAAQPSLFVNGRYPATPGAFDETYNGGSGQAPANLNCDISISKYDPTGANLLYATYLGGFDDEYPHSIIADSSDNLIVYGTSYSSNFPTTGGCPQPLKNGGIDLIVSKLSEDGSTLMGSTYMGGSSIDGLNGGTLRYFYADDFRGEVNIDSAGNIYVATTTNSTDFPVTTGCLQLNNRGRQDGILFSLDSDITTLRWSTYFGGQQDDAIYSIDIRPDGKLYISGGTRSTDLSATAGALQPTNNGGSEGFVSLITADGSSIDRTTYWGTSFYDQILSLDLDKFGQVFVVGHSEGDIEVKGDVQFKVDGKQFISKFNPGLDNLILSTVYGSGRTRPDITVNAFLVDECGKIFVSGWGGSLYSGPTSILMDMPISSDAVQKTTDGNDFHLVVFRRDAKEILYGTYFGGNRTDDHVDGGTSRFDKKGVIYQSVCSSCPPSSDGQSSQVSDFPTTSGAYSENNPSPRCSNASFKLAFGNLNRQPRMKEELYRVQALDTVDFTYIVRDPDEDTIDVHVSYPTGVEAYFINKKDHYVDEELVEAVFTFGPPCDFIGDTIELPVYAIDRGCPGVLDSNSLIKIVVDPPPVISPPEVVCLNFNDRNEVRLEWDPTPINKYFYRMYLFKVGPNGDTSLLETYGSQSSGSYLDDDVINPRENDYTYFLIIENKCGYYGPPSYNLSTVKEHQIPVDSTYLITVTVEEKQLKLTWLKSTEDDFGHYEIYKGVRGKGSPVYLTSIDAINDTIFYDSDVDIDNLSYCYQLRVSDDCGHLSALSNYGCSIVIRGSSRDDGAKAKPRFGFDLTWDEYLSWKGRVWQYELLRSVDTGLLRPIVATPALQRTYLDSDLDFDWGGYWFSVLAYEGGGSFDATSRSNDIYLIQPPLVFVPNAITANNDNLNDVFSWSDVFVKNFEMRVYNRWGEKVFETSDKNADWTGIYKNDPNKWSNVYFWIVTYSGWDNARYRDVGTVTIVK